MGEGKVGDHRCMLGDRLRSTIRADHDASRLILFHIPPLPTPTRLRDNRPQLPLRNDDSIRIARGNGRATLRAYPQTIGDWLILRSPRSKMCLSNSPPRF